MGRTKIHQILEKPQHNSSSENKEQVIGNTEWSVNWNCKYPSISLLLNEKLAQIPSGGKV